MRRRLIRGTALAVGGGFAIGVTAGVLGVVPAHADFHQDVQFFQLLDSHGIQVQNTSWATGVCHDLDAGVTPRTAINEVYYNSPLNLDQSMWFTASAIAVYCPWHSPQDLDESRPAGAPPLHTLTPNPPGIAA